MEESTPSSTTSEHASKRRMLASSTSRSAPASPREPVREDSESAFETHFVKPKILSDLLQKSNTATPRTTRVSTPIAHVRSFHPDASLVLVGIRGCGKRSLGFIAATALGRRFVTEEYFFQAATGFSRQDYLKIHGSQEFHKKDIEISRRMLDENRLKCVIECGLGSLTSSVQDHLRSYCQTNPVVHLVRDINEIKQLLQLSERSARMLESGDLTHRRCSNFEYFNLVDVSTKDGSENGPVDRLSPAYSFKLKEAKEDFSIFARFVTGAARSKPDDDSPFSLSEIPVDERLYSHALEVRLSWFQNGKVDFSKLESGGDVVEIIVDQWSTVSMISLSRMVADIRRRLAVPILISARRSNGGVSNPEYSQILQHGVRLGADFVAVDLEFDSRQITSLISSKGHSRIIGHFADLSERPDGWENDSWLSLYNKAERLGCDVVRLLRSATSRDDNEMLSRFTHKIQGRAGLSPPLIAYNVGPLGRTSQIFNQILTSVTHSALHDIEGTRSSPELLSRNTETTTRTEADVESSAKTMEAATPQITSREAVRALFHSFVLDPLRFYILGGSVSYSLSPAMHNSAYDLLGMDHKYGTKDIASVDELDILSLDPHLGGVAVVQPFKMLVMKRLASMSRHAEVIGAANTLLPLRSSSADGIADSLQTQANQRNRAGRIVSWHGENTDWLGITACLTRSLSPRNVIQLKTTSLVIGSGGMARAATYALLKMGTKNIFVYNRTTANAEALAKHFNTWIESSTKPGEIKAQVRVLEILGQAWPADFAMPTMIVSCVNEETTQNKAAANFELPTEWLRSPTGGVVIEMAYNNPNTRLIQQMRRIRNDTDVPWTLVTGLDVLPEQAIAQFELMTGRKAPKATMRRVVAEQAQVG